MLCDNGSLALPERLLLRPYGFNLCGGEAGHPEEQALLLALVLIRLRHLLDRCVVPFDDVLEVCPTSFGLKDHRCPAVNREIGKFRQWRALFDPHRRASSEHA